MGRLDILTKEYVKQPSVFADVFNQFLYHGRQVIVPDRLVEIDITEIAVPYGSDQAICTRAAIPRCVKNADDYDRWIGCLLLTGSGE